MNLNYFSKFRDSKVLVTGHTGFKGSWLSLWLKNLGANVHGISLEEISNPSHFSILDLKNQMNSDFVDIKNFVELDNKIKSIKPDFIFHLAAQSLIGKSYEDPINTFLTNSIGTAHVLESLRDANHDCILVLITSDKCYKNEEKVWGYKESDILGGKDPYSASKAAAENIIYAYISSFYQTSKVKIGVGRAGNVIGGGDWAANRIVPDCVKAWSNKKIVQIRNPSSTRPWQHVLEPISGYLNLAVQLYEDSSLHGEAFNFGPPENRNYSVNTLLDEMGKYWKQAKWSDVSDNIEQHYEAGLLNLNCSKAEELLKWESTLDFNETVKFTIDWYRQYYSDTSIKMNEVTLKQIESYINIAKEKGILWAT